jgi:hypothetical protein
MLVAILVEICMCYKKFIYKYKMIQTIADILDNSIIDDSANVHIFQTRFMDNIDLFTVCINSQVYTILQRIPKSIPKVPRYWCHYYDSDPFNSRV